VLQDVRLRYWLPHKIAESDIMYGLTFYT
jgi:hypothetical protein